MRTDFFHQAHLNNWTTYLAALKKQRQALTWDVVVLTAANDKQAEAYRYQLSLRQELGMLPPNTQFSVVADPDGVRIGSGGATLNVLVGVAKGDVVPDSKGDPFCSRRILILHSGGDSKRLPQYSAFGKIFSPIPRLLDSGRPSTLFDELFVALSGIPALMSPGVVIASGDVLLLFDHTQLDVSRPGFTGVAIRADVETAEHHGVFVADSRGAVQRFLHKPSISSMHSFDAVDSRNTAPVDTGIIYFGAKTAARLTERASGTSGWLAQAVLNDVAINFYGDFLLPLAPEMNYDDYLSDTSDGPATAPLKAIRAEIWETVRGTPFYVSILAPARFLHFGTTREYQRLITRDDQDIRALGGRRRVSHVLEEGATVAEQACILHSRIGADSVVAPGGMVEFSDVGRRVRIGSDAVVSNVRIPDDATVPEDTVVHCLPVLRDGTRRYVVRTWGVDDNPKAPVPHATLFGHPLTEWIDRLRLSYESVWPAAERHDERTLWNARLYPVGGSHDDAWAHAQTLLTIAENWDQSGVVTECGWQDLDRVALSDSYANADLSSIGNMHRQLFLDLVTAKVMEYFHGERCVSEWRDRIPTSIDMQAFESRLCEQAMAAPPSLESARLCFSAASLLRMTRESSSVMEEQLADRAFQHVATCMLSGQKDREFDCSVQVWHRNDAEARLPARVDFAGGWSDTPPHSLERGGTVLNAAVSVDGELPIVARVERCDDPVITLESTDLGVSATYREVGEVMNFSNPGDPLALHKAALSLILALDKNTKSLRQLLEDLGGGVYLKSDVRLPKGTGLGTSSLLAAALADTLLKLGKSPGDEPGQETLFGAAAAIEQMLTTGGGWQDQVGGVVPGVKLTRSRPGCFQELAVNTVKMSPELRRELDERIVLLDTGQRRLAKNLLREVMGSWLRRDRKTVAILGDIQILALEGVEALEAGDFFELGRLIWRHWELNKQLDAGMTNPLIDALMDTLRPYLEGAKLAGAGGGGFLVGIAKEGCKERIRALLEAEFSDANVRYHNAGVVWQ